MATTSQTSVVPTVDVSGYATGTGAVRGEIAAAVDEAYRRVGFLQIEGHGVSPELIAAMQAVTTEYFDLPLEAKMPHVMPPAANRGYSPPGAEALSYSAGVETKADLFQAFNAGAHTHTVNPSTRPERHAALYHENIWPQVPTNMATVWEEYIAEVSRLAQHLLRILATSLGLDEEFFAERADQAPDVLRALDYRSFGGAEPEPGQMRLGAHTDYGMITLLYSDPVPGLQLMGSNGQWFDVTPVPGRYLVNVGDMLAAWTNDRWRSTLHRVVPARPGETVNRRSMAFFHEANPDAIIEPLEQCVDVDNPPKYEALSAGDHLLAKVASARSMQTAETMQTTGDRAAQLAEPPQ